MRHSYEPRERRYVKGYGFLSFARNLGTHTTKVTKNLINEYSQKLADYAKKSATGTLKLAGKKSVQKTADATEYLVGNTSQIRLQVFQKSQQVNHTQMWLAMKYQKKDIYLHKKDKKLLMN